ncbi:hypothetical protein [uncultured Acetobacterium sp.]|uniref:hypothetical protein n=1 Tax=uncultured Acetobacterium sp. TaxID=217139 RepID=UPI0025F455BF|nr:hypothetical protein [uncultured Acetobacterium sp.]
MKMEKNFQNKKLNSKDYKTIERTADVLKMGIAAAGVLGSAAVFLKKSGVDGLIKPFNCC